MVNSVNSEILHYHIDIENKIACYNMFQYALTSVITETYSGNAFPTLWNLTNNNESLFHVITQQTVPGANAL